MEDEFDNCTDIKVCVDEILVSGAFVYEEPCNRDNKQGSIHNDASIKDENVDDLAVVEQGTELINDCTNDKMCLNETVISGGHINQKPCIMKDAQGSSHKFFSIKDEDINDLTVVAQETELITDDVDNKICVYETIISGGCIKQEPCDTENKLGSIRNNVDMKDCEECGEEYDLYCLKCPMLIRIFDTNNPDGKDNTVRRTLPKNFIDICETQSGVGIVALRTIPKGVVFGPFKGLDPTKDDTVSKWKLRNRKLAYTKDPRWLNWMQYIRVTDQSSHQNLMPFQYENGLYYRSDRHISVGDELLVCYEWDSKESEIQDTEDSYWEPRICEKLDDPYTCSFCCVGYKSISHLKAHNSTCIEKRNKKDFCTEIVRCDFCKIYMDKDEYSDYHMDRCDKNNEECNFRTGYRSNRGRPRRYHVDGEATKCESCTMEFWNTQLHAGHNDDGSSACTLSSCEVKKNSSLKRDVASHDDGRSFACALCPYKAMTKSHLKQHMPLHNTDKPFACTICPYKTTIKSNLKQHVASHNTDKPFACPLCSYKATRKAILKQHIATHNDDKPFACTLCPYKAKIRSVLKQHIATHNGDRPFACTFCPYKAKKKPDLKQHIATHNDDRPFACTLCPYKAKIQSVLKQHITTHNKDKPFACTLCPYKARTKLVMQKHIANHNGDRPFACSLCSYRTTHKSALKRHMAFHNNDGSST